MLLSDVLYISKKFKNNTLTLNESLKSSIIQRILKPFEYSNDSLQPMKYSSWKKRYVITGDAPTFLDVVCDYKRLIRDGSLTQDLCDTIEGRESVINTKYKKKSPVQLYNRRKENGFISLLTTLLQEKVDHNIGLSDINDDHIIEISPDEAKKKIYKNGLQFWCDYNENLRAITIDNTIVMYIEVTSKFGQWQEVNPAYHEKTDISNFTNNEAIEEFVSKAFKPINTYVICTNTKEIKEYIKTNNIKGLQGISSITHVYAVNTEGMKASDITEKIKSRKEYKDYLNSIYNLAKKNIERYKNIIKVRKNQGVDSKIIQDVQSLLTNCMNTIIQLQDNAMNNFDILLNLKCNNYEDIDYNSYDLFNEIKKLLNYNENMWYTGSYKSGRSKIGYTKYCIKTGYDYFVIFNAYINLCIEKCKNVIDSYDLFKEENNKSNKDLDVITDKLHMLKLRYNSLKECVDSKSNILRHAKEYINEYTNINIENILKPVQDFNFSL